MRLSPHGEHFWHFQENLCIHKSKNYHLPICKHSAENQKYWQRASFVVFSNRNVNKCRMQQDNTTNIPTIETRIGMEMILRDSSASILLLASANKFIFGLYLSTLIEVVLGQFSAFDEAKINSNRDFFCSLTFEPFEFWCYSYHACIYICVVCLNNVALSVDLHDSSSLSWLYKGDM